MKHPAWNLSIAALWVLVGVSCTATEEPGSLYSYWATIWQAPSGAQPLLVADGATDETGGYLGHYFREPVQIMVSSTPEDAAAIGALWIASPADRKCLPIKKWSQDGKTRYAICDFQSSNTVVYVETESQTLTEPLLGELLKKFVPDGPDTGDNS